MLPFFSTLTPGLCRRQWVLKFRSPSRARRTGATHSRRHFVSPTQIPNVGAEGTSAASALGGRVTFEQLGLHPPIAASLREAFPDVKYPTEVQTKFIPAILGGKDILLRDATGSGK